MRYFVGCSELRGLRDPLRATQQPLRVQPGVQRPCALLPRQLPDQHGRVSEAHKEVPCWNLHALPHSLKPIMVSGRQQFEDN